MVICEFGGSFIFSKSAYLGIGRRLGGAARDRMGIMNLGDILNKPLARHAERSSASRGRRSARRARASYRRSAGRVPRANLKDDCCYSNSRVQTLSAKRAGRLERDLKGTRVCPLP